MTFGGHILSRVPHWGRSQHISLFASILINVFNVAATVYAVILSFWSCAAPSTTAPKLGKGAIDWPAAAFHNSIIASASAVHSFNHWYVFLCTLVKLFILCDPGPFSAFELFSKRKMYCSGLTDTSSMFVCRLCFNHYLHPCYWGPPLFW